jgi:hypothetical protein
VRHEPKKIAEFRDVQLAISIPIRHLEFRFEKAQQLRLAYRAFVVAAGSFSGIVSHGYSHVSTAPLNSLQQTRALYVGSIVLHTPLRRCEKTGAPAFRASRAGLKSGSAVL